MCIKVILTKKRLIPIEETKNKDKHYLAIRTTMLHLAEIAKEEFNVNPILEIQEIEIPGSPSFNYLFVLKDSVTFGSPLAIHKSNYEFLNSTITLLNNDFVKLFEQERTFPETPVKVKIIGDLYI